ncbi:MAG: type II secretion system protein [Fimbriimonadaceae bacterium]|nr:type II secretion system protein [Fimbriimonadaceae bacterium]
MRSRGYTLIEVICVMVILAVLGALLAPVLVESKRGAMVTQSIGKMRQWHVALSLYAEETSERNINGISYPLSLKGLQIAKNLPEDMFRTGGVVYPPFDRTAYTYMVATKAIEVEPWNEHVTNTGGNPVVLVDDTHNPGLSDRFETFTVKFGIGLFYDGHIERQTKPGSLASYSDWEKQ